MSFPIKDLLYLKLKYSFSSAIATVVDISIFEILVTYFEYPPPVSNVISLSIAILLNFLLQYHFVFESSRKVSVTFAMAMSISLIGIVLSTGIIYGLCSFDFFAREPIFAKVMATGLLFVFNFYLKRYAFERRFI